MKNDTESSPQSSDNHAITFCKNALIGTSVSGIVYPAIVFKNMVQSELSFNPLDIRGYFKGITPFMASYVPAATVAMMVKKGLTDENSSPSQVMMASYVGGIASGPFCVIQEAVAQNMSNTQNNKLNAMDVVRGAIRVGGYSSLMRGTVMVSVREGKFAFGYLAAMPWVNSRVDTIMPYHPNCASITSAVVVGILIGTATTPFDLWRNKKQAALLTSPKVPSYGQIFAQNRPKQVGYKAAFKGAAGRSVACSMAIYLMNEGIKRFM